MKSIFEFVEIFLHRLPVDGRKSINGLSEVASAQMTAPITRGTSLFVFTNRRRNTLKILYWDRTGFALWVKRLEKEQFRWPMKLAVDMVYITPRELSWLLEGLDITRMKPHSALHFPSVS